MIKFRSVAGVDARGPGPDRKAILATGTSLLLLVGLIGTAQTSVAQPASRTATSAGPLRSGAVPAWAHQGSDLKPDENVRFGVLPNGMRYALMRNATPPGVASLRLRIDAGSLNERDDQQGLAHFIEHMALNETKSFPEGELLKTLERAGLKFGPDTNAFTSFEQTVYMLDLPKADAPTVDTALTLMREVAGDATLAAGAIDSERNIILAEERARDTPVNRMIIGELQHAFRDDLLARRIPIGTTEVIRTAPRERFVEFYNAYYRPERATLVAVGDFDVAAMEAKIRARFADWRGQGSAGADAPPTRLSAPATDTRVLVDPGVPTRVSMTWIAPLDTRPDSAAVQRERIIQQLGLQIVNRRLERVATSASPPPFIGAGAGRHRQGLRGEIAQISAVSPTGQWRPALAAIEQEQRRVIQHGFTQAELGREISEHRAALVAAAAGEATRTSPNLAMWLIGAINEDAVFLAPATQLALFDDAVRGLTAAQVGAATARMFAGPPQIFLASPAPVEAGEGAVLAAFNQSRGVAVAAPAAQQAKAWPYADFGTPGAVVERREIAGTGATAVRFANGARLVVKPTAFKKDEIAVAVWFGEGQLGLSSDAASPAWGISSGGFVAGGLGKLTFEEVQRVLTGAVVSANARVDEDAFLLYGTTRPQDFPKQLQLLAAYVREPGWRPTGWDRLRNLSGTIHDQFETTPGGVLQRDLEALLRSGDKRFATPDRGQMAAMTIADARTAMEAAARDGALEVIVVGDIGVDEAIRQTAATFAALPPRRGRTVPAAFRAPRFPAATTVTRTHAGRADQALAFVAWPTPGRYADPRESRVLEVLAQVVQLRLNAEIREKQGTAYSPNASHGASETLTGYGYLTALIETTPTGVDSFLRDATGIARDVRDRPVTADELQRARKPLVEAVGRSRTSDNQWWTSKLAGIGERSERAESIRVELAQYESVTPADLQRTARSYLVDDKAWRLTILPQSK